VEDLVLDGKNPRHDTVAGTREAIQALLAEGAEKLVNLAGDIKEQGVSPIDLFLVMPNEQGLFTVLEGNRRVAAIKLLANPALAGGHPIEQRFRQIAVGVSLPDELSCVVASSREEARHWLELRHTGEREGRGVVPWSAAGQNRFSRRPGTQIDRAMLLADTVEQAYSDNVELLSNLDIVRRQRATTLGRLISDPYIRQMLGIEIEEGELKSHYSRESLEPIIAKVLEDLAGDVTVSNLKTKAQRKKYIDERAPGVLTAEKYDPTAASLKPTSLTGTTRRRRKLKKKVLGKKNLFEDLVLQSLGSRISNILGELQQLDVDRLSNAAAVLVRAVLELSVAQFFAEKGWKQTQELRNQVKRCLQEIDPTGKDRRYQAVRVGLQDGTSVLAIATLHGYVHNPHYHPTGTELRSIAANYESFLQALDELV
jgi:hypothetical protein